MHVHLTRAHDQLIAHSYHTTKHPHTAGQAAWLTVHHVDGHCPLYQWTSVHTCPHRRTPPISPRSAACSPGPRTTCTRVSGLPYMLQTRMPTTLHAPNPCSCPAAHRRPGSAGPQALQGTNDDDHCFPACERKPALVGALLLQPVGPSHHEPTRQSWSRAVRPKGHG